MISARFFAAVLLSLTATSAIDAQETPPGLSAEQALTRMTLPEGFHVELVASEPTIRQPVAATFDERGRLWVVEYLQYPAPAGLKPVSVDQYLRTEYDRVPEPPPRGPRGADRIVILDDPDGDGHFDQKKTFVEGLNLASAVAVGHGGVYVVQAPYLLFYPDRDRDDRPDADPDVLLTGFGLQDAHAVANSLTWGPDGWLYGAEGSTVTSRIEGQEFQQGIWRFHPTTHQFELFAEGGGNTWGLDFDRIGRVFGSSNAGFIAFHMVQNGYYWKGFAKHGPLHNPRSYGYFDALAYDGSKVGGHVTPGGINYKGDNFPPDFQNVFIGGNLLSNAVYWHVLAERGSTMKARHGGTLLDSHDPWFRPVDLLTGPDGCLYVVDWYDRRASHLDPRDTWDRSNGRIYRVVHGDRPKVEPFDLSTWSTDQLLALIDHPNDWWPETARRVLFERRDSKPTARLRDHLSTERTNADRAMRLLWMLDACGGLTDPAAMALLDHPLAAVRAWAIRRLGDDRSHGGRLPGLLIAKAQSETSPIVRSQLAASASRWPSYLAIPLLLGLTTHDEDADDPFIPLQIWWAMESVYRLPEQQVTLVERFAEPAVQSRRLVREHLLERIARALVSEPTPQHMQLAADLLARSPAESAPFVIRGLDQGLAGVVTPARSPILLPLSLYLDRDDTRLEALRVAARLRDSDAYARACAWLDAEDASAKQRLALIELLGQVRSVSGQKTLLARFEESSEPAEWLALLNALAGYDDPAIPAALLRRYAELDETARDRIRGLMASRPRWADMLVSAVEDGRIPARDLRPNQVAQIAALGDKALTARLEKAWGRPPAPTTESVRQRIAEIRGILPEGDKGDPARGRVVFQKLCAGCHRLFVEGGAIGPDLSGVERHDLDFLLTSLVDPSAVIRGEYQGQTIALNDGRILTGLIIEENANTLTLIDSQQQKTTIARSDIDEIAPATRSIMPEGQLETLKEGEIRDLFRYLQSSRP